MSAAWGDKMQQKYGYYDYIEHGRNRWEFYWNALGVWLYDHNLRTLAAVWSRLDERFIAPPGVY